MAKPPPRTVNSIARGPQAIRNGETVDETNGMFGLSRNFPKLVEIDVGRIRPNPDQPRRYFDEGDLQALAEMIRKHGLQQPITVKRIDDQHYELVAGERRWLAHQRLKRPTIFAIITSGDSEELALIENMVRSDLHPVEAAVSMAGLAKRHGYTQEELAKIVGRSRTEVASLLSLTKLPPQILNECQAPERRGIAKGILFELAMIDDAKLQDDLWGRVKSGEFKLLDVRAAKKRQSNGLDAGEAGSKGRDGGSSEAGGSTASSDPAKAVKALNRTLSALGKATEKALIQLDPLRGHLQEGHREQLHALKARIDSLLEG